MSDTDSLYASYAPQHHTTTITTTTSTSTENDDDDDDSDDMIMLMITMIMMMIMMMKMMMVSPDDGFTGSGLTVPRGISVGQGLGHEADDVTTRTRDEGFVGMCL
jgi:hypothetical protein